MYKELSIKLPWPPSVNNLWRAVNGRSILSKEARDYKKLCKEIFKDEKEPVFDKKERLFLTIEAYPPDRRRRDLDNLIKPVADQIPWYHDDSQLDGIAIVRGEKDPAKEGFIVATCGIFDGTEI